MPTEYHCSRCGLFLPSGDFYCRTNDYPSEDRARCPCGKVVTRSEASRKAHPMPTDPHPQDLIDSVYDEIERCVWVVPMYGKIGGIPEATIATITAVRAYDAAHPAPAPVGDADGPLIVTDELLEACVEIEFQHLTTRKGARAVLDHAAAHWNAILAQRPGAVVSVPDWVQHGEWETDPQGTTVWLHGDFRLDGEHGEYHKRAEGTGPDLQSAIAAAVAQAEGDNE